MRNGKGDSRRKGPKKDESESSSNARFIAGRNPVREQIEADSSRLEKLYLQKGATGSLLTYRKLASDHGIPVQIVPTYKLNSLVPGVNHQGVILVTSAVEYQDVDDMLAGVAATREELIEKKSIVVILDHIQDPYNLGAIIRSCVAAGAGGVIIPDRKAAPVTPATVKTSAGTINQIPIARVGNLLQVVDQMKERGYWIAGAEGTGETSMQEMDWDRPIGLVIGSEEKGMTRMMRKACDYLVKIPMRGPAESLNASVAAGILLFQASLARPE
ncbi:MAG: 23S rRNA (guanosine(2251)-2'-O)-methyltransferase RlmB [Bacteroidetes Order II. Incertae sedis bacterium]|jgi:23S rRNA (guanosine2251-2'-O)-methyltransferase|nr:23S rRNA (guanosine(2251)-2'-O)-methyltransferase RlmB [Bacteroidetes Order II. bacterium]MBT4052129.1 23S rRNA (guanosine(2251)-2'-O)-methyltransferase RlmB [Bacteroidetes Order II. bacterium]MBT4603598.1 23S rRNA (guanosine(2251)-2'-O)-methyltransferase RlmB [Bacteroidetes Order II. bacterium]MBT5250141.1 23S rRNA (guanosine(2251)-2'-O)-methyltransferase RlmB [Bacteroidetes Order II. bacterium]MBT6201870.1 23S rRNA (guanosine(2251)-2'-O)-methyltransferase RlmB [Bacteroidetes Order II. bact